MAETTARIPKTSPEKLAFIRQWQLNNMDKTLGYMHKHRNTDKFRANNREYMRQYRAKKRAEAAAATGSVQATRNEGVLPVPTFSQDILTQLG